MIDELRESPRWCDSDSDRLWYGPLRSAGKRVNLKDLVLSKWQRDDLRKWSRMW